MNPSEGSDLQFKEPLVDPPHMMPSTAVAGVRSWVNAASWVSVSAAPALLFVAIVADNSAGHARRWSFAYNMLTFVVVLECVTLVIGIFALGGSIAAKKRPWIKRSIAGIILGLISLFLLYVGLAAAAFGV